MASNWMDLPEDLLTMITDKLLLLIKDYIVFGATCVKWRAIFIENRHRLPSQLPLLMIPAYPKHEQDESQTRSLYSLLEKKVYDFQLPVPHNLKCRGSSFGWLVIVEDDSLAVRLINPFLSINNEIHLPSLKSLEVRACCDDVSAVAHVKKAVLSANPTSTSDYIVMVIYGEFSRLGFLKPGDKTWTFIEESWCWFADVIYQQGQFYGVQIMQHVVVCDLSTPQPRLTHIAPPPSVMEITYEWDKKYLVESSGELFLVRRKVDFIDFEEDGFVKTFWTYRTIGFQVFKVDPISGKWVQVKSLCGHMLFLGDNSSLSLLASDFPGCKPNCIYFTDDRTDMYFENPPYGPSDIGVFNIQDESFEPHYHYHYLMEYQMGFPMIIPPPIWVQPTFSF